jgi:hypothetical protein
MSDKLQFVGPAKKAGRGAGDKLQFIGRAGDKLKLLGQGPVKR